MTDQQLYTTDREIGRFRELLSRVIRNVKLYRNTGEDKRLQVIEASAREIDEACKQMKSVSSNMNDLDSKLRKLFSITNNLPYLLVIDDEYWYVLDNEFVEDDYQFLVPRSEGFETAIDIAIPIVQNWRKNYFS